MATHRMSIFGSITPGTSGNVYVAPSSSVLTNDRFPGLVLIYKDTATKDGASGQFTVPKNYVGTPKIVVIWAANATSGNCVWDADTKAIASGESMDPSTDDDTATQTTATGASAFLQNVTSITLTGTYAVDDLVQFTLSRDGAVGPGTDTLAAAAIVWDVLFEYVDV